ncbi:MAG: NAD(+)/NADH kinase [Planctomycetes bacterium]|nr:NAD(+)/NADH kinase [Planctomycetota bacterium]
MILLVGDGKRVDVVHAIAQVEPLVREYARDVVVDLDGGHNFKRKLPKLVINFGGDGSILHIARRLGEKQVPILGVNFGKFGFLAEFELPDLLVRLKEALALKLPMRKSLMLQAAIERAGKRTVRSAVNDVVFQRAPDGRMSTVHVAHDGAELAAYVGDGLVVATPLGSTAHNLSAGGPILHPEMDAIVLTPICAHTLSIRPLALPAGGALKFWVEPGDAITLTLDGMDTVELSGKDVVEVRRAKQPITLVAHPSRSYFDALRLKFGWTARSVVPRR